MTPLLLSSVRAQPRLGRLHDNTMTSHRLPTNHQLRRINNDDRLSLPPLSQLVSNSLLQHYHKRRTHYQLFQRTVLPLPVTGRRVPLYGRWSAQVYEREILERADHPAGTCETSKPRSYVVRVRDRVSECDRAIKNH
jgi:hypothetical protein